MSHQTAEDALDAGVDLNELMAGEWKPTLVDNIPAALTGIAAHSKPPEGQAIGATFTMGGQMYYVTEAELERIRNLPSAQEVTAMVARVNGMFGWGDPTPEAELADDYARNDHQ